MTKIIFKMMKANISLTTEEAYQYAKKMLDLADRRSKAPGHKGAVNFSFEGHQFTMEIGEIRNAARRMQRQAMNADHDARFLERKPFQDGVVTKRELADAVQAYYTRNGHTYSTQLRQNVTRMWSWLKEEFVRDGTARMFCINHMEEHNGIYCIKCQNKRPPTWEGYEGMRIETLLFLDESGEFHKRYIPRNFGRNLDALLEHIRISAQSA